MIMVRLKINNSASNIDVRFNTDTSGDGNVSVDDIVQDINDALATVRCYRCYSIQMFV